MLMVVQQLGATLVFLHEKMSTHPSIPPSVLFINCSFSDFPSATVYKNLLANAEDMGLTPSLGRSHMPLSKLSQSVPSTEPVL